MGSSCFATVIVKATFGLVNGGPARLVAPLELVRADRHFEKNPAKSVEEASEIAPYLPSGEVVLRGHAHAPGGRPAPAMSVRLAIFRDRPLLDKTLHIFGDRAPSAASSPAPFQRMPIVYERAFGGAGFDENPIGVGAEAAPRALPNIVDPNDARRPAGFGPISRYWGSRKRLLAGAERRAIEATIADIPEGFDWRYFHAAPSDQLLEPLAGDEWIVLDGLTAAQPRLQARLPSARAVARWYNVSRAGAGPLAPIELAADTLLIDADQQVCSLIWRGNFPIEGPEAARRVCVLAGVELQGYPLTWPDPKDVPAPPLEEEAAPPKNVEGPSSERPPRSSPTGKPRVIKELATTRDADEPAGGARPAVPFVAGTSALSQPSPSRPAPRAPSDDEGATRTLTVSEIRAQGKVAAVPFGQKPKPALSLKATLDPDEQRASAPPVPFGAGGAATPPAAGQALPRQQGAMPEETEAIRAKGVKAALPFLPAAPGRPPAITDVTTPRAERAKQIFTGTSEYKLPVFPSAELPFVGAGRAATPVSAPPDQGAPPAIASPPPAFAPPPAIAPPPPAFAPPPAIAPPAITPPPAIAPPPPMIAPPSPSDRSSGDGSLQGTLVERSRAGKPITDLALAGADLSGLDLTGAILQGANLKGAKLRRAVLASADLSDAALAGADLTETVLRGADLSRADLRKAFGEKADLSGAKLEGVDLRQARLQEAIFNGAQMQRVNADKADLSRSRFVGADLSGANLRASKLRGAILARAQLEAADLRDADLEQANVFGASRKTAKMSGANTKGMVETDPDAS